MSFILNIDTATETAHVSIAKDGMILQDAFNNEQKNHAGFLQSAIKQILKNSDIPLSLLNAIAVTSGPGSYTGLRVGMASAKGLCYALNKPLITIGTLEVLAQSALHYPIIQYMNSKSLLCPMIDARRLEVFTALYNSLIQPVLSPCALVLEKNSFAAFFDIHPIIFFGNGSLKWKNICFDKNAIFQDIVINSKAMCLLSLEKFEKNEFTEVIYAEPTYIKEFYINHIL